MTRVASSTAASTIISANSDRLATYYNSCRAASYRLADDLMCHGHPAEILRCSGLKTHAPDADQRWHAVGQQSLWVHYLVRLEDTIIDLTRRQFFPDCAVPFYQSEADFTVEWDNFGPADQNPRFRS
jgi:hypothetical protein